MEIWKWGGAERANFAEKIKYAIMTTTQFTPVFPGMTTETCVNLAGTDCDKPLMPVALPAGLNVPEYCRPIARLDNDGSYLLTYGNIIEVMEPSGECRFSRTLDSEPLCVVPGPTGTIIVMTRKRAYTFTKMTLVPLDSSPLVLPALSVSAETPVSATMPSVRLSVAYGHGDSISLADTARLVEFARHGHNLTGASPERALIVGSA